MLSLRASIIIPLLLAGCIKKEDNSVTEIVNNCSFPITTTMDIRDIPLAFDDETQIQPIAITPDGSIVIWACTDQGNKSDDDTVTPETSVSAQAGL